MYNFLLYTHNKSTENYNCSRSSRSVIFSKSCAYFWTPDPKTAMRARFAEFSHSPHCNAINRDANNTGATSGRRNRNRDATPLFISFLYYSTIRPAARRRASLRAKPRIASRRAARVKWSRRSIYRRDKARTRYRSSDFASPSSPNCANTARCCFRDERDIDRASFPFSLFLSFAIPPLRDSPFLRERRKIRAAAGGAEKRAVTVFPEHRIVPDSCEGFFLSSRRFRTGFRSATYFRYSATHDDAPVVVNRTATTKCAEFKREIGEK